MPVENEQVLRLKKRTTFMAHISIEIYTDPQNLSTEKVRKYYVFPGRISPFCRI